MHLPQARQYKMNMVEDYSRQRKFFGRSQINIQHRKAGGEDKPLTKFVLINDGKSPFPFSLIFTLQKGQQKNETQPKSSSCKKVMFHRTLTGEALQLHI